MKKLDSKSGSSRPVSLLLLIPGLLFGIISAALAFVGLGLIPLLPACIGIILSIFSLRIFKSSFRTFAIIVLLISTLAATAALFRGMIVKEKVADDTEFDSTLVKTSEGIDSDLQNAFGDSMSSDTIQ
jgi:glucan phosphoethanolaminetransferase (alkaline phosphatase superfamily)